MLPLLLAGCQSPTNPSFPITYREAQSDLKRIEGEPRSLDRPLVFASGFLDPGIAGAYVNGRFKDLIDDERILTVHFNSFGSFDEARLKLIAAVDEAFPPTPEEAQHANRTVEVDVIGFSMGGLVARYAAATPMDDTRGTRRLRIYRLFTIASPHRGAALAQWPSWNQMHLDMRAGSPLLQHLDAQLAEYPYPLSAYTRLGDGTVGEENAAPPGHTAWWVGPRAFQTQHLGAMADARIQADILRRLRGETTLTTEPAAPLPE